MSRYLPKNTMTDDFDTLRTLSGPLFIIPERLASIPSIVLAFTMNKQPNTLNYIYRYNYVCNGYNMDARVLGYK